LGLEPSKPVAVALAYLRPVKGHSFLLEAFARVISALPSARLLIIGEGPLRASLQAQAEALGLQSAVRFLGHRSDAQRLLAAGDLLVNSSLSEGTPLSVMEAMALGLPVVATNVGGVPKLVLDGETGMLVPPAEVEALAAALLELMRNAEKRRALGEAGRRRALEQFSIETAAAKYQALYDKLLEKRANH
jgi:glycosyltransferase involved in cell wall biosynthesis